MSQEYCSSYEENPMIVKCLSMIYDEIVEIKKHLFELNKSSNNDNGPDKPFRGPEKTEPGKLGHCSNCSKISSKPAQQQQQTAHLSNKGSNHSVHSEPQTGTLPTLLATSSNNNSTAASVLMKRPKPYPLHRPLVCPKTKCLNSLKDLCLYDANYRGPLNVMGVVHRASPSVIQSDNLIKTSLAIVDQSMIEVLVTINETKLSKKFYRGQVVMFNNAQMFGKNRRLKVNNNYQIEPKQEKTDELHEWYLTKQHEMFGKMTTIKQDPHPPKLPQ